MLVKPQNPTVRDCNLINNMVESSNKIAELKVSLKMLKFLIRLNCPSLNENLLAERMLSFTLYTYVLDVRSGSCKNVLMSFSSWTLS